ncbi:hypothetical protein VCSRO128_1298 [Vibrio cholerae]|uniref:DUF6602 domain-containing protein n=1 Tax=Vibrio cholerae TaxID=666 RepID=UPI00208A3083|nr:DUF6602 domain-containing protein [Vibrio cholerae]EHK7542562.1 hypothetical protein [Vibrio cholerae]EJY4339681.1 hypothetical protein [Vibrio cholerae]EKF9626910.1 hypothetical protein [Vibrio cholerae]EKF9646909.1 hypothetical protein [Vibrio cholerae]EKF9651001.1 hypothetical protein [Vibrio cholerae]
MSKEDSNERILDLDSHAYFNTIGEIFSLEVRKINEQLQHSGLKGTANEDALISILKKYLPENIGVNIGAVISSSFEKNNDTDEYTQKINQSRQADIILYDKYHYQNMFGFSSIGLFPIEVVLGVIEVKTTLDEEQLHSAIRNLQSIQSLMPIKPMFLSVFSYKTKTPHISTIENWMKNAESLESINVVYCLDFGFIEVSNNDGKYTPEELALATLHLPNENNDYEYFTEEDVSDSNSKKFKKIRRRYHGLKEFRKNVVICNETGSNYLYAIYDQPTIANPERGYVIEEAKVIAALLYHLTGMISLFPKVHNCMISPKFLFLSYIPISYWYFVVPNKIADQDRRICIFDNDNGREFKKYVDANKLAE